MFLGGEKEQQSEILFFCPIFKIMQILFFNQLCSFIRSLYKKDIFFSVFFFFLGGGPFQSKSAHIHTYKGGKSFWFLQIFIFPYNLLKSFFINQTAQMIGRQ